MRRWRLRRQVARVLAGRPLRPERISQDDVEILSSAIAIKAAVSLAEPDPELVAMLARRVQSEQNAPPPTRPSGPTRRELLAGGGVAAVISGVTGLVAGRSFLHGRSSSTRSATLEPSSSAWTAVATSEDVAHHPAVLFQARGVHGVLSTDSRGQPMAISGVCTHQGCVLFLALGFSQPRLECPCQGAAFTLNGKVLFHERTQNLDALPRLEVRMRGDAAEVLLPNDVTRP